MDGTSVNRSRKRSIRDKYESLKSELQTLEAESESLFQPGRGGGQLESQQTAYFNKKGDIEKELRWQESENPWLLEKRKTLKLTKPLLTAVPESQENEAEIRERENAIEAVRDVQAAVEPSIAGKGKNNRPESVNDDKKDCSVSYYHPCTGSLITEENPLNVIQKKLIELQRKQAVSHLKPTPAELLNKKRSDLLIWFLNEEYTDLSDINEDSILNYQIDGRSNAMSLFESYWDILIALGQLPGFEITKERYMFNGKVELLKEIPGSVPEGGSEFYSDIFKYLSKRDIQTSSSGGASDITVFTMPKIIKETRSDPCSYYKESGSGESTDKPSFIFASAKKYKKEKSISQYDIQNIYTAAKAIDQTKYNKKIILLVSDEEAVNSTKQGAARKYISQEAREIYGQNQMFNNLRSLYDKVKHIDAPITWEKIKYLFPSAFETSKGTKNLRLQLHQKITVDILKDRINEFRSSPGSHNRFLVGILPRGGKTYIAGGIVRELQPKNVVVLLGAKSETQVQFIEELFEYFNDFNDYKVINVKDERDPTLQSGSLDSGSKHIFVMSIELFKTHEHLDRRPLLKLLRGLLPGQRSPVDLFISDEAHLKQATRRAEDAVGHATAVGMIRAEIEDDEGEPVIDDTLESFLTIPIVYMTGTFAKPKSAFKIPDENTVVWSYANVQKAKMLDENIEYFTDIYGHYFTNALDYMIKTGTPDELNIIMKGYQTFPEMHLMETHFYPGVEDKLLTQGSEKGIPEMSKLFIINKTHDFSNPSNWHLAFQFDKQMRRLINFLGPDYSQVVDEGSEEDKMTSVMTSIDRISQRTGDRLRNMTSDFVQHSQLWFFPKMTGNPLGKRMMAMAGIISRHKWFRDNFVIYAVSQVNWQNELSGISEDLINRETNTVSIPVDGDKPAIFRYYVSDSRMSLKKIVIEAEILARAEKKGLIILAQNMLNLGISLPCVDIVVLLDGGENVDERIQKMYRALTPSPQKRDAYVVDLNYFRTVKAIMEYSIKEIAIRKKRNPMKEEKKNMLNDMFNIYSFNDDIDLFQTEEKRNKHIQELLDIQETKDYKLPTNLVDAGKQINRNLMGAINVDTDYFGNIEIYKEEPKKQKELIRDMKSRLTRAKPLSLADLFPDESEEELVKKTKAQIKKGQEDYDNKRLAFYDIFSKLLRYGVFATDYKSISDFKNSLESNPDLRKDVHEFLIKKHVVKGSITIERLIDEIILPNLQKIIDSPSKETSFIAMKEYVNDDTKYPAQVQDVLNYINEHLAPKDAERHKYGEVFTPMSLVHEMLDTLPEDVWKNPDLSWLDPANGMGNFPIAVFLRLFYGFRTKDGKYMGLMEEGEGKYNPGLTKVKSSEALRRRHIVQKMLFMSELNGKNVAISKKLFTKLADGIEPNIIKRDFLKDGDMDFNGKKINKFDIVMGNPPFNKGAVRVAMVTNKTRKERNEYGSDKAESGFWFKFVDKVLRNGVLKSNGFLLFIHPITWFKPDMAGAHDLILSKQIRNIRIYTDAVSKRLFGGKGEISVAYYLLENKEPTIKTKIINMNDGNEEVKLNNKSIIIKQGNTIFQKIQATVKLFGNGKGLKHTTIKECSDSGSHKLITILEDSGEIKYVKSSVAHPDQGTPKVIVGGIPKPIVFFDKDGEYGLYARGQRHYFIGDNLNKINDYFKTKLSTYILKFAKFEQKFIKPSYFPDVRVIPDNELKDNDGNITGKINDETLANYFKFTDYERDELSKMPDPIHPTSDKIIKLSCSDLKKEASKEADEDDDQQGGSRMPQRITRRKSRN